MGKDASAAACEVPGGVLDVPLVVVTGHYGTGKTNLSLNLALSAVACGRQVTVVDLDVVNPFFRSSDYRDMLAERGVRVVAPVFAGTNVDGTSLSGTITVAFDQARDAWSAGDSRPLVIVDAGGDDAGATALGRFADAVAAGPYAMLYVVNRSRNLTQEPAEAACVLREIEETCGLSATAVVNNTHLQGDTDAAVIERGISFAQKVAQSAGLPLAFTTVPVGESCMHVDRKSALACEGEGQQAFYPVRVYVRTPWDM